MLTFQNFLFENDSTNRIDFNQRLLAGGKYDILMFTLGRNDKDGAMEMKSFLRKIGINDYTILNSYLIFNPNDDVYVIFTKKGGEHEPFRLMIFGNHMIYDFFKECYPMFENPSPIMTVDEFIEYVNKTALLSAKAMYSPRKTSREI